MARQFTRLIKSVFNRRREEGEEGEGGEAFCYCVPTCFHLSCYVWNGENITGVGTSHSVLLSRDRMLLSLVALSIDADRHNHMHFKLGENKTKKITRLFKIHISNIAPESELFSLRSEWEEPPQDGGGATARRGSGLLPHHSPVFPREAYAR